MEQINLFDLINDGCIKKICNLKRSNTPLETKVELDEFTEMAQANFDYKFDGVSRFYPFEQNKIIKELDFQILVICGASGSGKSTFSKYFGEQKEIKWDNNKAIISHFKNPQEATEKLIACGISSIPVWCKPRNVLSVGEGFRADISRQLEDNCVIDEFTSNVDRNVALSCASSIGNYIRKKGLKKCVFVSCHKDFIDTLCPDYVIDLDDECLYDTRGLPKRKFEFSLFKGRDKEYVWRIFRQHHYMTQELNKASTMYTLYFNKTIVGCCFVLPLPNGYLKNAWRIHRIVISPDYQGLGIGTKLLETICDLYKYWGATIYIRTSHIKLRKYFQLHKQQWVETKRSGVNCAIDVEQADKIFGGKMKNNIAYSYKYNGNCKYNNNLNYELINAVQQIKSKKPKEQVKTLFDYEV